MVKVNKTSQAELPIVGFVGLSHLGLITSTVLSTLGFKHLQVILMILNSVK